MPIVDLGWNRIKTNLYWLDGRQVEVGVFASVVGSHLTMIAVANHEGTRRNGKQHIPPRRFITAAMRKNKAKLRGRRGPIAQGLNQLYRRQIAGSELLHQVGLYMTTEIQDAIHAFSSPANAASTVRIKGFNDPLIRTGKLAVEGITYKLGYR